METRLPRLMPSSGGCDVGTQSKSGKGGKSGEGGEGTVVRDDRKWQSKHRQQQQAQNKRKSMWVYRMDISPRLWTAEMKTDIWIRLAKAGGVRCSALGRPRVHANVTCPPPPCPREKSEGWRIGPSARARSKHTTHTQTQHFSPAEVVFYILLSHCRLHRVSILFFLSIFAKI